MEESINWSKYFLNKRKWEYYATLSLSERRQFLKERGLQYPQVPKCEECNKVFFNCMCEGSNYTTEEDRIRYYRKKRSWQKELNKTFDEKIEHSFELVDKVLKIAKENKTIIYLAYSGGIDSECCLQLFKEGIQEGIIKVTVGNTLNELPETRKRWKEAEDELGVNFIYALPEKGVSFKSNAIKYGLPLFPRSSVSAEESTKIPTRKCCSNLKKKPMGLLMKDAGGKILGIKATEGQSRRWVVLNDGDCFISKTQGIWYIRPIAYWTIEDEWKFQELIGFNYNGIYDKTNCGKKGFFKLSSGKYFQIRSGCAFCPQGIYAAYLEWLKEYYPKWHEALLKIYDEVILVRNRKDYENKEAPRKRTILEGQETGLNVVDNLSQLELLRNKLHKVLYDLEYEVEFSEQFDIDIDKITKSLEWIFSRCSNTINKLKSLQKE